MRDFVSGVVKPWTTEQNNQSMSSGIPITHGPTYTIFPPGPAVQDSLCDMPVDPTPCLILATIIKEIYHIGGYLIY